MGMEQPLESSQEQITSEEQETFSPEMLAQELEKLRRLNEELLNKNQELYARLKKTEAKYREVRETLASNPNVDLKKFEEKVELRIRGYSPEEIAFIESYAKGSGKSLLSVAEDEYVKAAIDVMRQKKQAESKIPPSSNVQSVPQRKSWEQMSREERKAKFSQYIEELTRKGREEMV